MINIFRTRILLARNPFLSFKKTTIPSSAVGVRVARRRSLLGELQDVPDDCLQLDPLDVPGDNFRTARSHSMSTASCLQIVLPIALTISIKNSRIEIYPLSIDSKNQNSKNLSTLFFEKRIEKKKCFRMRRKTFAKFVVKGIVSKFIPQTGTWWTEWVIGLGRRKSGDRSLREIPVQS